MLSYPVKVIEDDNDTFFVVSPDFPELNTYGENKDDALQHAVDAFEEAIAGRIADREDIPSPSRGRTRVTLPTLTAAKVLLYQAMCEEGVRKVDLARRLDCHMPQVDRLLNLHHASRLDQLDAAFRALNRHMNVSVEQA